MTDEKKEVSDNGSEGGVTGFANLSEEDVLDVYIPSEKKEEKADIEAEKKEEAPEAKKEEVAEKEEKEVEEKEDGAELGDDKEKKEEEDGLKNPDEEEEKKEIDSESSWINVAKEIGIELKEDSFEAFKEAQKTFIEERLKAEVEAAKQVKFEEETATLPLKEQVFIRGLKQGLTVEQINKPYNDIKALSSLSDADLVAEDFKGLGYPQDVIDFKIEKLTESGELEMHAKEIRVILDKNLEVLDQKNLDAIKEIEVANEKRVQEAQAKEVADIKKHLETVETFMDAPLSKKNKEYVVRQLEQGKYNSVPKSDLKMATEFILYKEFGPQAISNLKSKSIEEGRDKKAAKLHAIPPVIKSSGGAVKKTESKDPVGNWGALEHLQP